MSSRNAISTTEKIVSQELDYLPGLKALNTKLSDNNYKYDETNFQKFITELEAEVNFSKTNIDKISKLELARNLLNIFLFAYFIILIGLGFIFYVKNKQTAAFVISLLILFTIPMIMFLEIINTNYFFLISDLCDSVNQSIYENKMPIYGKGLGWISSCHSSDVRAKGYMYNYDLFKAYSSIQTKIDDLEKQGSTAAVSDLKTLQSNILTEKRANLDPILSCDAVYSTLIKNEVYICKYGPERSYNIFITYFWLMISILFMFWGFNRNVMLIKRRVYEMHEKLMAEESAF